jgi:hypothetical protein
MSPGFQLLSYQDSMADRGTVTINDARLVVALGRGVPLRRTLDSSWACGYARLWRLLFRAEAFPAFLSGI